MEPDRTVTLSLISHTNVGKTTLARTLLRRDVGEVLDQPHVTDVSEAHALIETVDGARLQLWDTPGFGDTARLLKRLRLSGNPLGWLLSQVWDRFRDRPLWCSQQAVRNVQEEADVVLYLVNAAEDPGAAAYVDMEMEILAWIGRPVILLLNQTGPPAGVVKERADAERWRGYGTRFEVVREVLSMDAFARCWVQEHQLLEAIGRALPADAEARFAELQAAWREENLRIFQQSMGLLAAQLAEAVCAAEPLEKKTLGEKFRSLLVYAATGGREGLSDRDAAMGRLAESLDKVIRTATLEVIALHGLEGSAAEEIFARLKENYSSNEPVDEGMAGVLAGFVTGALGGLLADLAAGGLTFGGGAVAGGILGAAGGVGLAKGYNLVRGTETPSVRWSAEFFEGLVRSSLLRYLAVAHFGRGRGRWKQSEYPPFWQEEVAAEVSPHRSALKRIWERAASEPDVAARRAEIEPVMAKATRSVLCRLWPEARSIFRDR